MRNTFQTFFNDEDGAVTVDWVVLTAALVALALLILGIIQTGSVDGVEAIWSSVDDAGI